MRAGLSTIQQTLTAEAASVLTRSIAEAARRNHGQTTPLHVAATLLAAPSGLLRQACIRSHPQSSHPLQCRALELCFSVALDRLPASNPGSSGCGGGGGGGGGCGGGGGVAEPPISNALMAALKRAQANQRRGCPEQQQQPLLAVKVELEQLIISILDDPSVSRVMREASFSSVAVKAVVEQSLSSSSTAPAAAASAPSIASLATATSPAVVSRFLSLTNRAPPCHNLYINPRLHQHQTNGGGSPAVAAAGGGGDQPRTEEVKRILDILLRPKKRNPILVGDCNPDAVMREVLHKIQSGDVPPQLRNTQVLPLPKEVSATAVNLSQITIKIRELGSSIESMTGGESGVILDLGDLKWLVESYSISTGSGPIQPPKTIVSEAGRVVVEEMGRLLKRLQDDNRLWLVGTAASATYLRCQVYRPNMENDWDLQAVPIAPRSSLVNTFSRFGGTGILSTSVERLAPTKSFLGMGSTTVLLRQSPETTTDHLRNTSLCPICMGNYDHELANLVAKEFEKHSTRTEASQALPQWLQLAKLCSGASTKSPSAPPQLKEEEQLWKQSTEELLKRWTETCSRLHPNFHQSHNASKMPLALSLSKPLSVFRSQAQSEPKFTLEQPTSSPVSPVRTDLVLGNSKFSDSSVDKTHETRLKDFTGCLPNTFSDQQTPKLSIIPDIDTFKKLYKGLAEKVGWQQEAASAIATVVLRCKSGNGKRRAIGTKGDTWLLLVGPDKVGKRKMASALSELMFGTGPTVVNFGHASCTDGNDGESNLSHRGRTYMDQIVEAVRRNPFSAIVLEDIDQADMLLQGKIKQAIERGRLPDSHGREVSLGSVIFVLIADCVPEALKSTYHSLLQYEEKMLESAQCGAELELSTGDKPAKRRPDWLCDNDQPVKLRKESSAGTGLSLDLNLSVGTEAEAGEGSRNSSELSSEHEYDKGRMSIKRSTSSLPSQLVELVDEAIMFKPVDFAVLRRNVLESASAKFAAVMGQGRAIRVDEDALDRIVSGLWFSGAAFDDWAERVLDPSLKQARGNLRADGGGAVIVRLSTRKGDRATQRSGSSSVKGWLPTSVAIAIDGANDK
ncbi:protein SMAX1-like isoform X2 [Canna indica]|uniref:Protein SMAX1-like isoform X2 n=1 Tax=Canna indica TaxID=4628 RepID=A0AAQ3QNB0_9LILI|nr:protein SMAX1-like isoform X2 [Canna indica]